MKLLSTLVLLAASASAVRKPRQRAVLSRYELSLAASFDAPFHDGAVSLKENAAGFYAAQPDPLIIDVEDGVAQPVRLATSDGGFLSLEGTGGLRDLVVVGGESEGAGGFEIEQREGGEKLYNVTWEGEGQWRAESIGGDDYALKWWDGESITIATVFPVQLVGRLIAQS